MRFCVGVVVNVPGSTDHDDIGASKCDAGHDC